MKKTIQAVISILLIFTFLTCTGCGTVKNVDSSSSEVDEGKIKEYIVPDSNGNWGYPTPYGLIPRGPGFIRMSLVFDSLIWKAEDGSFVPALAQKWDYDAEENSYTFILRDNIKWHDGEALTCDDVIFTINYINEHPIFWLDLKSIKSVEKIADNTIKFQMSKPFAPFYANIAGSMPILPEHIYKNISDPIKQQSMDTCIGSGPFKLVDYRAEEGNYVLQGFEDYYLGKPKVEKLKLIKMNPQMQPEALLQGNADAIFTIGDAAGMLEQKGMNVIDSIGMVTKIRYNHNKQPFNNKEFRHAIAYAINCEEVIATAHRGHAYPAEVGILHSGSDYYEPNVQKYKYDIEQAQEILEKLGYKKENGFFQKDGEVLSMTLLGNERVRRDVDIVAEQLNKIGIKVTPAYKDTQTCDQMLKDWEFDIAVVETGAVGDPIFLNRDVLGPSFTSDRYFENDELKKLLGQQVGAVDFNDRKEILSKFQKLYADELPSYHIYFSKFFFAYNDKLDLYFTDEGVSIGIPLALNKMAFVK